MAHLPKWMNKNILLISFSALFADLGYQAVQAIFPIYLVITLSSNGFYFGIANAIAFGGGALLAYIAGILGSTHSRKWLAVIGSVFILLMPLVGITVNPFLAIALFALGWWARNFRVPPRRAMLTDASNKDDIGKAFGFLHALDIGGGMLSILSVLLLLGIGFHQNQVLLLAAIPISISIILLAMTKDIRKKQKNAAAKTPKERKDARINRNSFNGIIIATAVYGFSYYSLGFPILTITQSSNIMLGIGSYALYLGVSAVIGYLIGSMKGLDKIKTLGYLGYAISGVGTIMLSIGYYLHSSLPIYYFGIALMGFGFGVVETMEPTIISLVRKTIKLDEGMGALQGSRSVGLFCANLIMGVLYLVSPADSYLYAAIVSFAATAIVLYSGREFSM